MASIRITWIKSTNGYGQPPRKVIQSLGLHHLHDSVVRVDSPTIRGMVEKVQHLVKVEEVA
ncbi:MAG: 50S ribosomal protein L30 [Chloroflexi bacterium]|nr:50S ribosomal protein L30 [Chloroflexota bacterium]